MTKEIFWIDLQPVDALFFRDHRSMRAGMDNRTTSIPPSPLTIFGSIGTWLIEGLGISLEDFKAGNASDINSVLGPFDPDLSNLKWRIAGPYRSDSGFVYFPAPANLYYNKDSNHYKKLVPSEKKIDRTNLSSELRPLIFEGGESQLENDLEPLQGWLTHYNLEIFLSGDISENMEHQSDNDFHVVEERFGIGISPDTLATKEGLLFTTSRMRFRRSWERQIKENGFSIQVHFKNEKKGKGSSKALFESILSRIGGLSFCGGERGRVNISFREQSPSIKAPDPNRLAQDGKFILYLSTPAIFTEGWKPWEWPSCFKGAEIASVAMRKPGWISGWVQGKGPRSLLRTVPEGTVYFFETSGWDKGRFIKLIEEYHLNKSISDYYPCAGFGISCIGAW